MSIKPGTNRVYSERLIKEVLGSAFESFQKSYFDLASKNRKKGKANFLGSRGRQ